MTINLNYAIVIFIVFLVLKLSSTIAWSWWWVTSPLLIPGIAVAVLVSIGYILNNHGRL